MKPIQLRIASTLVFLAFAPVVGHGYVTYTWAEKCVILLFSR